jgi:hypothetical protein
MSSKTIKWQGKDVQATIVGFEILKEDWRVYDLQDGSILRVKNNLIEVCRLNSEHSPDGNPVYVLTGQAELCTITSVPEHLKKPPTEKK